MFLIVFSFHHYKHLNQICRRVVWLGFTNQEEARIALIASEFDRTKEFPVDDHIYFLITQCELAGIKNLTDYIIIREELLTRAHEMIKKKMPSAWVAVRAYAWLKDTNLGVLPDFLDATDDLQVWQVTLQCMTSWKLSLPDLLAAQSKAYLYTVKAIEMEYSTLSYVVAVNGVQALMRLKDERALELWHRLPRRSLDRNIAEQADLLIKELSKSGMTQFIPTLMELKTLSEKFEKTLTK